MNIDLVFKLSGFVGSKYLGASLLVFVPGVVKEMFISVDSWSRACCKVNTLINSN